jgi:hypothetical protein
LEIVGVGFTVITTVKLLLFVHPFASIGLTVKVTDCAVLEVLEKVPAIVALIPLNAVHVTAAEEPVADTNS